MISNSFAEYMFCSAWTSVEEKLPDKKGWYIVSCDPRYLPTDGVELVDIFGWDGEKWITVDACLEGFKIIVKDETISRIEIFEKLPNFFKWSYHSKFPNSKNFF